jgi:ABC-type dipeptide/oligopeptide/nickel transport system ATPase component
MRQRAMIAIALRLRSGAADRRTNRPPRSTVTIQAQIFDLMRELKRTSDAAIILITHDLGVGRRRYATKSPVMYAGEIVERAPADALFEGPEHPYTVGLLASTRGSISVPIGSPRIDGVLPDMTSPPDRLPLRRPLPVRAGGSAAPRRRRGRSRRALVALPARAAGAALVP